MIKQITSKWETIESGIEDVIDRVAVFDNVYDKINQGLEWVQQSVTTCSLNKEPTMRERCVMVNEWNRGVVRKRLKIEAQMKGTPLGTYEPKLHPSRTITTTLLSQQQPSLSRAVHDRNTTGTGNSPLSSSSRGHRLGRIRNVPFGTPTKKSWSSNVSSERSHCPTNALMDNGLSPIAEGNEDNSPKVAAKFQENITGGGLFSRMDLNDLAEDNDIESNDHLIMWPLDARDDDGTPEYWYTEKKHPSNIRTNERNNWRTKQDISSYSERAEDHHTHKFKASNGVSNLGDSMKQRSTGVSSVSDSRKHAMSDLKPNDLSNNVHSVWRRKMLRQFPTEQEVKSR
jgi:hypothetical protein